MKFVTTEQENGDLLIQVNV